VTCCEHLFTGTHFACGLVWGKECVLSRDETGGPLSHPAHILLYQQAILELDNQKLSDRIAQARAAIEERQGEMDGDGSEQFQLEDMLRALKVLEQERK
jgi:hypothetical protein